MNNQKFKIVKHLATVLFIVAAVLPVIAQTPLPNGNKLNVAGTNLQYTTYGAYSGIDPWTPGSPAGGVPGWFMSTDVKYNGADVAQSGNVTYGQYSVLSTTVIGPGTLAFFWKTTSRNCYLDFCVGIPGNWYDSPYLYNISPWLKHTKTFDDGSHDVHWNFYPYDLFSAGSGYLSQVSWTPTGNVAISPKERSVSPAMGSYDFDVRSNSAWTATVSYMDENGDVDAGADWLTLNTYSSSQGGSTISASAATNSGGVRTAIITFTMPQTAEYPTRKSTVTITQAAKTAFDDIQSNSNLTWKASDWFEQGLFNRNGSTAVQSGFIGQGETSTLEADVVGPGIINFYWSTSCDRKNTLTFTAYDNVQKKVFATRKISGETGWKTKAEEYVFPVGNYTLKWEYQKNDGITYGNDAAWLSDVVWTPSFETYVTTISTRTSTIREMSVKVKNRDPNKTTENAKIHFRAPVAKSYTIRMAHARDVISGERTSATSIEPSADSDTRVVFGRMWASDKETAFTFTGENMYENGKTSDGKRSTIGVRGLNFPVEFVYYDYTNPATTPRLHFSGVATLDPKFGNISGYTGVVYGVNIDPACCTLAGHNSGKCSAEQGEIVGQSWLTENPELMSIANVYYPAEYAAPQPAHFFGTFTSRYNAKDVVTLAKGAEGKWDAMPTRITETMPKAKKDLEP